MIEVEARQNVALSLVAVMLITSVLLPSPVVAIGVFLGVLLTLADVLLVLWLGGFGIDSGLNY